MRAMRPGRAKASPRRYAAGLVLAALCGMPAAPTRSQDAATPSPPLSSPADVTSDAPADAAPEAASVQPPPGPLKVMSWNVASSPYAIAMRKLKSEVRTWRTSFGSERRTIDAPEPPQSADITADIVLLQGITNPRAMRRLFPARKWRLVFARRALEALPKGSVFTAPLSSVEVEAIAVRFRPGLRIVGRVEQMDDATPPEIATAAPADAATASPGDAAPASPARASSAPGVAVKVVDRGRSFWLASASIGKSCDSAESCTRWSSLLRWRTSRIGAGDAMVAGGRLHAGEETTPCEKQAIETDDPAASTRTELARGEHRALFGCVAELTLPP